MPEQGRIYDAFFCNLMARRAFHNSRDYLVIPRRLSCFKNLRPHRLFSNAQSPREYLSRPFYVVVSLIFSKKDGHGNPRGEVTNPIHRRSHDREEA